MRRRGTVALAALALLGDLACGVAAEPLPACEWCGAGEAPAAPGWDVRIAAPEEPGEALVLSGTVFVADGRSPAPGVILYLYHTNAGGIYPKRGDETGNGRRHGYLRGWLRTDERGRYRFTTIRPGSYPGGTEPAHIHVVVKEPGKDETYLDDFNFEDDPLVTPAYRARLRRRGGSGTIALERDAAGRWFGRRDLVLPR